MRIKKLFASTMAMAAVFASLPATQPFCLDSITAAAADSDSEIDEKFIVAPADTEVKAGETVSVNIMCENGSNRKAGQFVAQVIDENLPIAGATATMTSLRCTAVSTKPEYSELNGTWYCDTLDSGEPQEIDTSKPVAKFDITIPADAKPGTYEWKLDRFHVVESGYDGIEFDAVLKTGKLTVKSSQSSSDPSDSEIDDKFIITPADAEAKPGETVSVNIMCENGSNRKAGQFVAQVIDDNLPIAGATATMTSLRCSAISTKPEYTELNGTWYCDTLDSGEPQEIDTSKPVAKFDIKIPANAKPGTYEWKLDRFHVVESGYDGIEFDAVLKTGKLTVTSSEGYMLGDVNSDGKVDAKDASLVLVEYSKMSTGETGDFTNTQQLAGDVNFDSKIDAKDASFILSYYALASTTTGQVEGMKEYMDKQLNK